MVRVEVGVLVFCWSIDWHRLFTAKSIWKTAESNLKSIHERKAEKMIKEGDSNTLSLVQHPFDFPHQLLLVINFLNSLHRHLISLLFLFSVLSNIRYSAPPTFLSFIRASFHTYSLIFKLIASFIQLAHSDTSTLSTSEKDPWLRMHSFISFHPLNPTKLEWNQPCATPGWNS